MPCSGFFGDIELEEWRFYCVFKGHQPMTRYTDPEPRSTHTHQHRAHRDRHKPFIYPEDGSTKTATCRSNGPVYHRAVQRPRGPSTGHGVHRDARGGAEARRRASGSRPPSSSTRWPTASATPSACASSTPRSPASPSRCCSSAACMSWSR